MALNVRTTEELTRLLWGIFVLLSRSEHVIPHTTKTRVQPTCTAAVISKELIERWNWNNL